MIFAHAGDTLSPSLMSGLDRGAHIIALTNMIAPDIFVPGNHEFDFGKEIFFKRMAEAKFPLYAANLRGPDGKPLPGFRDRAIVDARRRAHRAHRRHLRRHAARLEPGRPAIPADGRDHQAAGRAACARKAPTSSWR